MPEAKTAVVVGGGYVGLESAEQFRRKGLEVTLVEMLPQVMPFLDKEMAEPLHRQLEHNGVRLELGRGIAGVEAPDGKAIAVTLDDRTRLPADLVLLGVGVRPNVELAADAGLDIGASGGIATDDHMRTSDPDIYAVGDAAEYVFGSTGAKMRVPLAGPANRTGRLAGEHAATGSSRPAPRAWATSVVRVFGATAGITGLSLTAARKAGFDANAVHVIALHHAGYYPGCAADGAQARLREGQRQGPRRPGRGRRWRRQAPRHRGHADPLRVAPSTTSASSTLPTLRPSARPRTRCTWRPSRRRTISTASRRSSSRTPICATTRSWTCASRPSCGACRWRNAPTSSHIPLDQLRDRLAELDPAKPTVVACRSGLRSYVGTRILKQHGFAEVYNLSGAAAMREFALNRRMPAAYTPTSLPSPDAIMID